MSDRSESSPGWMVAANSAAGSVDDTELGRAVLRLAGDAPVHVRRTESPDDVVGLAREHPDLRLVVVGGDGTISSAVDRLIDAGLGDRPIGLLPGGTGNDFVRAMGLPTEAAAAADGLVRGQPMRLSALRVTGRYGVNACHVGLGAAAARTAAGWKERLGPVAYPLGAAVSGARQPAWRATITADGDPISSGELLMAAVVLGRTIGGGTELAPESSVTDGAADLLVSEGTSAGARARLGVALLRQDPGRGAGTTRIGAARVRIESEEAIPVNLDGEDLGDHDDLSIEVVERAWTVLAPG